MILLADESTYREWERSPEFFDKFFLGSAMHGATATRIKHDDEKRTFYEDLHDTANDVLSFVQPLARESATA